MACQSYAARLRLPFTHLCHRTCLSASSQSITVGSQHPFGSVLGYSSRFELPLLSAAGIRFPPTSHTHWRIRPPLRLGRTDRSIGLHWLIHVSLSEDANRRRVLSTPWVKVSPLGPYLPKFLCTKIPRLTHFPRFPISEFLCEEDSLSFTVSIFPSPDFPCGWYFRLAFLQLRTSPLLVTHVGDGNESNTDS